ncbi:MULTISPECIES: fluoride efflux transporter CrcB [Rhizobiaceae]|uniref:Fluoride-specific ion channel FluC n=1 Tax=Aliirhizobium cellulosilyticum TaxID=393664 RepID=A0A7W6UV11_9HYPH|nr:fluoride efflux transporter CrcB [Rhizobium cellulosilyticum]MBB4347479.1 CrcB protein [Rhizobium cellulosilyticum]MBB4410126.1 CrcB protein [Rhizobium cellulosilyticum]MBB4444813.1 CrcB protein [Rhizobium cellulosilyticum]
MTNILLAALGGAIGSVLRYLVGVFSVRWFGPGFPWGTLTVNVVGSFIIGLSVEMIARRFDASMELRVFIVTGIIGGFTTWSSFSLDTMVLFERGAITAAAAYVIGSLVVSFAAVFAGLALGRAML